MDEKILKLLRERSPDFLSGEEMSQRLKVSRAAIWKRVRGLRSLGYEIEASTRSGYRLVRSPDLLTPAEVKPLLKTKWLGKTIHYFESLDSTNSTAYQLAMEGAREGDLVIAEGQTRGRGRLGREWFSPPFLNLYLSVILRPKIPLQQASLITLMAAVATSGAIERFSGLRPSIKWPNDILMSSRKVAGLLNEVRSETDRIHFVILGIGVNLNVDRREMPHEVQKMATSLKEEMGQTVSRKAFLQSLLSELEKGYTLFLKEGGEAILKTWRERARIEGKEVRVTSFGETLVGRAVGVDPYGALILKTRGGERKRVVAGDVQYRIKQAPNNKRQIRDKFQ